MDRFLKMLLVFLVTYFVLSFFIPNPNKSTPLSSQDIGIQTEQSVAQGNLVKVTIQNNLKTPLVLGERENPPEKLVFEHQENGRWIRIAPEKPEVTNEKTVLQPGEKREFSFSEYNTELFFQPGNYKVVIQPAEGQEFEAPFEIYEPGFFRTLFRAVYKLIYNAFILLLMAGGHDLGLAIILITVLIKLILWGFNQKSLESQQKMQKIQPELKAIREKYKDDQQRMAAETMAVWKKHKVSPFATLTPILIQFPVLIALFYVIREGLLPHNRFLLYPPFKNFDFSHINQLFLGVFNLANHPLNDYILLWLPFVVAGSQFWAMKIAFQRAKKQKDGSATKKEPSEKKEPSVMDQMESMNKTMIYIFPAMIFFFSLTTPAGVGLYWLVSTLIGIGQQYIANKRVHQ